MKRKKTPSLFLSSSLMTAKVSGQNTWPFKRELKKKKSSGVTQFFQIGVIIFKSFGHHLVYFFHFFVYIKTYTYDVVLCLFPSPFHSVLGTSHQDFENQRDWEKKPSLNMGQNSTFYVVTVQCRCLFAFPSDNGMFLQSVANWVF